MRRLVAVAFLCLPSRAVAAPPPAANRLNRVDDRRDLYQSSNPLMRRLAASTVALVPSRRVHDEGDVTRLGGATFGSYFNLCRDERFWDQPSAADCSGTLIGRDLVLTAGHCVKSQRQCERTRFVFGYAINEEGEDPWHVPSGDVYGCSLLVASKDDHRADWAVVRLDRAVAGRDPIPVDLTPPTVGTPVAMIGYPGGLPAKIAGGAVVREDEEAEYFEADLDAFGGNSGSGVFNEKTGALLGILVRGESPNYLRRGRCNIANVCHRKDGLCEAKFHEVTRLTVVKFPSSLLPSSTLAELLSPPAF